MPSAKLDADAAETIDTVLKHCVISSVGTLIELGEQAFVVHRTIVLNS